MYKLIKALISANNWYVTYILHAWIWYNNGLKFGLFLKKLLKISAQNACTTLTRLSCFLMFVYNFLSLTASFDYELQSFCVLSNK